MIREFRKAEKPKSANSRLSDSSVPISSIQGDLRRAFAVGPRHRNGITTQATETRLHDRLLTIVNSDGSGVNDRNQDANPLNGFSLIFRERYAYLEEVIR